MHWPPRVGDLLPRGSEAVGIRKKLTRYSLETAHSAGGPKAQGFAMMLGITIENIDYLEAEIRIGILLAPVKAVQRDHPYGIKCLLDFPLRGLGNKADRVVNLRTAWLFSTEESPPRLVTAFPKPQTGELWRL